VRLRLLVSRPAAGEQRGTGATSFSAWLRLPELPGLCTTSIPSSKVAPIARAASARPELAQRILVALSAVCAIAMIALPPTGRKMLVQCVFLADTSIAEHVDEGGRQVGALVENRGRGGLVVVASL